MRAPRALPRGRLDAQKWYTYWRAGPEPPVRPTVSDEPLATDAGPTFEEVLATAREKFHCPACGAEAHWNPGKQALICPYCGTESPAVLQTRGDGTSVVERDLAEALRTIPDSTRGWQATKTSVRCQSCRAISVFDPSHVGNRCEFCGASALVPYEQIDAPFRPESLLPFTISETRARELIREWYGRLWLAPNAFRSKAITDTVTGLYLPYWTFDANAHARYTAEAGTYYYTGSGKNRRRHVRWRPTSGAVSHVFDDELVCASVGVDGSRLRKIEPFPTSDLIPFDAGYLAGWTVERYQIDLVAAAQKSRDRMLATLRRLCAQDIKADTHRNLSVNATFSHETFKHILVPIWLLTYMYRTSAYQVVVNGVTGSIAGSRPWSWIKIGLIVLLALVVLLAIAWFDA